MAPWVPTLLQGPREAVYKTRGGRIICQKSTKGMIVEPEGTFGSWGVMMAVGSRSRGRLQNEAL